MKEPILNQHPTAVALRIAAIAFGKRSGVEPEDDHDREGGRLNRELLRAALAYAEAVKSELET